MASLPSCVDGDDRCDGVHPYLIVLMFPKKLIVSVECAIKLGSHRLSVTEDKWGVWISNLCLWHNHLSCQEENVPKGISIAAAESIWIVLSHDMRKACLTFAVPVRGSLVCYWWFQCLNLLSKKFLKCMKVSEYFRNVAFTRHFVKYRILWVCVCNHYW